MATSHPIWPRLIHRLEQPATRDGTVVQSTAPQPNITPDPGPTYNPHNCTLGDSLVIQSMTFKPDCTDQAVQIIGALEIARTSGAHHLKSGTKSTWCLRSCPKHKFGLEGNFIGDLISKSSPAPIGPNISPDTFGNQIRTQITRYSKSPKDYWLVTLVSLPDRTPSDFYVKEIKSSLNKKWWTLMLNI